MCKVVERELQKPGNVPLNHTTVPKCYLFISTCAPGVACMFIQLLNTYVTDSTLYIQKQPTPVSQRFPLREGQQWILR